MEEIDEDHPIILTTQTTSSSSVAGMEINESGVGIEEKDETVLEGGGVAGNNARGDEGVLEGVAIGDVVDDANASDSDEDDNGFVINVGRSTTAPRRSTLPRGSNVYIRPQAPTTGSGGMTMYGDGDGDMDAEEAMHKGQNKDEIKRLRFSHHRTAFDVDIESLETHPWRLRNVDLSDYFNYGFTEAQWIQYSEKQLHVRAKVGLGPYIHKPAVITATNLPRPPETQIPSSSSSSSSSNPLGMSLASSTGNDASSSAVVQNMVTVQVATSTVTVPSAPSTLPASNVPVIVPALPLQLSSGQPSQPQHPQQHAQHGGMMGGQGQGPPMHGGHGSAGWNMQQQQMQGMMAGGGGGGWMDPRMQQGGYHMMGQHQQHQQHHQQQHQPQHHQHGPGGGGGFPGMGGPMGGGMSHGQQGFGPGGGGVGPPGSSFGRDQSGGYHHSRDGGGGPSRGGDGMRDGGPRDHRERDQGGRGGGDGRKRDRDMVIKEERDFHVKEEREYPMDKRGRGGEYNGGRSDQQQYQQPQQQQMDGRGRDGRAGGGGGRR